MSVERGLFSVADGMGGYAGGQVASSIAIRVLDQELPSQAVGVDADRNEGEALLAALQKANKIILEQGREEEYLGMGTTVTTALIADSQLVVAWGQPCLFMPGRTSWAVNPGSFPGQ